MPVSKASQNNAEQVLDKADQLLKAIDAAKSPEARTALESIIGEGNFSDAVGIALNDLAEPIRSLANSTALQQLAGSAWPAPTAMRELGTLIGTPDEDVRWTLGQVTRAIYPATPPTGLYAPPMAEINYLRQDVSEAMNIAQQNDDGDKAKVIPTAAAPLNAVATAARALSDAISQLITPLKLDELDSALKPEENRITEIIESGPQRRGRSLGE